MRHLLPAFFVSGALAGCSGEPDETPPPPPPACDGELQAAEDGIDSPFDEDGDGWFGDHPGCAAAHGSLDCDDNAPERSPGADEIVCNGVDDDCSEETGDQPDVDRDGVSTCDEDCDDEDPARAPGNVEACWDDIDNNCDGDVDPGCGLDWNGTFSVVGVTPLYQCAFELVQIDFTELSVVYIPPLLSISTNGAGQPGVLNGEVDPDTGEFSVSNFASQGTALSCDETYTLAGRFVGADRVEATLIADYGPGACLNCTDREFPIAAER